MENLIIKFVEMMTVGNVSPTIGLAIIIIILLVLLYTKIFSKLPKNENFEEHVQKIKENTRIEVNKTEVKSDIILKRLDNITQKINNVDLISDNNIKELKDIQHDITYIKQILDQFHGHLMYNRSSDKFGNRELK